MAFIPSDAYVIGGHGAEPEIISVKKEPRLKAKVPTIGTIINDGFVDSDSSFIVPDNCMIVVKGRPGELAYQDTAVRYKNKVGDASKQKLFRNPLSNRKQLIKELGSVVVYKPGDRCPNYRYEMYYPDNFEKAIRYTNHVGLLKTPLETPYKYEKFNDKIDPENTPIADYVNTVYKESVYPAAEQVLEIILNQYSRTEMFKMGLKMETGDIELTYPLEIAKILSITQKELLQIGEDGIAKRPGVYYNFVCRAIKSKHNYYVRPKYAYKNKNTRDNVNPNIQSALNNRKATRNLIKRLIGEAETRRKPLIRNL